MNAPQLDRPTTEEILMETKKSLSLLKGPGDMNSHEWVESLRHINCMEKEDFKECFGEDGDYLWNKFVNVKEADVFEFLCYLDLQNGKRLYDFCLERIRSKKK